MHTHCFVIRICIKAAVCGKIVDISNIDYRAVGDVEGRSGKCAIV